MTTVTTVVIDPQKKDSKNKINFYAIARRKTPHASMTIIIIQVLLRACDIELTTAVAISNYDIIH